MTQILQSFSHIQWKDTTSYSRSDKEKTPKVFETRVGRFRVIVHRVTGLPEAEWYFSIYPGMADSRRCEVQECAKGDDPAIHDLEEAKRHALNFLREDLLNAASLLDAPSIETVAKENDQRLASQCYMADIHAASAIEIGSRKTSSLSECQRQGSIMIACIQALTDPQFLPNKTSIYPDGVRGYRDRVIDRCLQAFDYLGQHKPKFCLSAADQAWLNHFYAKRVGVSEDAAKEMEGTA